MANIQPRWAIEDEDIKELTEPVIGPERAKRLYNFGSMRRRRALAGGSDWPVSGLSPLEGIQVAITRRALNAGPGEGLAAGASSPSRKRWRPTPSMVPTRASRRTSRARSRWGSWPTWSFWSATSSGAAEPDQPGARAANVRGAKSIRPP